MASVISHSLSATITPAPSPPPASTSPASDDSEVIDDLSFDYIFDNGEYVRTTKGPSKNNRESASPATSEDKSFQPDFKPPSPLPALSLTNGPVKRSSLSRSESSSFPNVLEQSQPMHAQSVSQSRSFQRVASTPASGTATPGNASSLRAMRPLARRVTSEDREGSHDPRMLAVTDEHLQEEKENLGGGGRPLSFPLPSDHQADFPYMPASSTPGPTSSKPQGPTRMVMPMRNRMDAYSASSGRAQAGVQRSQSQTQRPSQRAVATRSAASVSFGKVESIMPDGEDTDPDDDMPPPDNPPQSRTPGSAGPLGQSGSRPRRSASLSDALANEDDYAYYQSSNFHAQSSSRPTTSLGFSTDGPSNDGPRRVMMDERDRNNVDALVIQKKYRREADEAERM
ncbi:hypothetical protein B0H12DRAFT_659881 [Mycena haematopus]|nr:hypothetical protein B0H12DRAFT_659881 [Mycena haematopus]